MTPPPFPNNPADRQNKQDDEQLQLLSVFHFVGAGLAVLGIGFLVLHYSLMQMFFNNPEMWKSAKNTPPFPREFFKILIWFYLAGGVYLAGCMLINILSGLFLRQRKHRTFSLIVAGINCIHIPLGTALGVFTIIVLQRDSVRAGYLK
ncbi:MAG: hypothetical protein NTZ16_10140 [Verrucomicrobia bacterium]|nr:hypothetical protein [Verrucomicrobiota bacterium]